MCGRGVICLSLKQVQRTGKVKKTAKCPQDLKKIVNFSPGMSSPVVLSRPSDGEREVHQMLFGLIPSFTSKTEKPNHYIMFNASTYILIKIVLEIVLHSFFLGVLCSYPFHPMILQNRICFITILPNLIYPWNILVFVTHNLPKFLPFLLCVKFSV